MARYVHSVQVYRTDLGDCTNRGETSPTRGYRYFTLYAREADVPAERPERPSGAPTGFLVRVERRGLPAVAMPAFDAAGRRYDADNPRPWFMFGGNFVWSTDSRFRDMSEAPIPVHDRHEGR